MRVLEPKYVPNVLRFKVETKMLSNELSVLELCATKTYFCSTVQNKVCENLRLRAKKEKKYIILSKCA